MTTPGGETALTSVDNLKLLRTFTVYRMCSFSGATCTSRVRHNADYVPYAKIRFDL